MNEKKGMDNPTVESNLNELEKKGYEWVDVDTKNKYVGVIKQLKFPDGKIRDFSRLNLEEVSPFLKEEGLIELIGCTEHPSESPIFIKIMEEKGYDLKRGFEALEKRTRLRVINLLLAKKDKFDKPDTDYACDEVAWWVGLYPSEESEDSYKECYRNWHTQEEFYSPEIIEYVTKIFLRYAPPIGTRNMYRKEKPWVLEDYLTTPKVQEMFKDDIPYIGESWKECLELIKNDPVSAIKEVLSNLPAYNAGKIAFSLKPVFRAITDKISRDELIKIVSGNKNIGEYDLSPFIEMINSAYGVEENQ